jgi:hypothetical protein
VTGAALRKALRDLEDGGLIDLMIAQNRTLGEREVRHGWYEPDRGYVAYAGLPF